MPRYPADGLPDLDIEAAPRQRQRPPRRPTCSRCLPLSQRLTPILRVTMRQPVHVAQPGCFALVIVSVARLNGILVRRDQCPRAGHMVCHIQNTPLLERSDQPRALALALGSNAFQGDRVAPVGIAGLLHRWQPAVQTHDTASPARRQLRPMGRPAAYPPPSRCPHRYCISDLPDSESDAISVQ